MSSINHSQENNESYFSIDTFFKQIGIGEIIHQVNFKRRTPINPTEFIKWLLTTIFVRQSLYRAKEAPAFTTRTVRNFLNDGRINWQKFVCLLASAVIKCLRPFIDSRRRLALIIDDSLFARPYSKRTELLARVYDHDKHEFLHGYRALTLGWSDANTFLPVNFALMSSKDPKNILGPCHNLDRRSLAGRRRYQAQSKMNQVAVELVSQALKHNIPAQYVLFDSWYSSPKMFDQIKQLGLDGIGMLKRSTKVYYRYRGRLYSVKALYERLRSEKRSPKATYQYSCVVKSDSGIQRKANNYLVLATTKVSLHPDEIIQLYGRRWQIETYFKAAKQYLRFDKTQVQNYDGLCGHLAIVMMTYDLLAWQERQEKDERTIGDLFYIMGEAMPDLSLTDVLVWFIKLLNQLVESEPVAPIKQLNETVDKFISSLPQSIAFQLQKA
ncbi:transposase [Ligilactobacillus agilis]|uniref:IS4 family transposase n=1 Tax=Ligilactobacillus agilis TaxID=1601 RepID=UPI0022E83649|nr:transposase [Ligilactobacillus agilis]